MTHCLCHHVESVSGYAWPHLLEQQFINTPCDHGKHGRCSPTALWCKQGPCSPTALWCKQGRSGAGHYSVTGSTPLHEAAAAGHQGIVEALVAANADLAIRDCMVSRHCRLLASLHHPSAIVGNDNVCILLYQSDFNDNYYCYLLSLFVSVVTVVALCHCCSESSVMWLQGRMPLHRAISAGQLRIVRYCLSKQSLPEIDGQDLVSQPSTF